MSGKWGAMERKEIMISDTFYVFVFTGTALEFYVDPYKSERYIELSSDELEEIASNFDIFDNQFDGQEGPLTVRLHRRVPIDSPVKVYKEAMKFATMCIGKHRPTELQFAALEADRWELYERVANKLGKKFGYYVYAWLDEEDEEIKRFQLFRPDSSK